MSQFVGEKTRPNHYKVVDMTYEPIKVIQAWDLNFCFGNAVKYIARAGKKSSETKKDDLQKAIQYLQFELDSIK